MSAVGYTINHTSELSWNSLCFFGTVTAVNVRDTKRSSGTHHSWAVHV